MKLCKTLLLSSLFLFVYGFVFAQHTHKFIQLEEYIFAKSDSLLLILQKNKPKGLSEAEYLFLYASALEKTSEYVKADSVIKSAYQNISFTNDSALYIRFLLLDSELSKLTSDYENAIEIQYKALNIAQYNRDTLNIIKIHTSLAEVYRATFIFGLGLEYLHSAEVLAKKYSGEVPPEIICRILNRRAAIFFEKTPFIEDADTVAKLSLQAMEIARKIGNKHLEAISANEYGSFFYEQRKTKIAEEYLLLAINNWDELGYLIYKANACVNLARVYNYNEEYTKGITLLTNLLKEIEYKDFLREKGVVYEMLGRLHKNNKDFEIAYKYASKAKESLLYLSEVIYAKRVALIATQYEVRKKEDEILRQEKEIEMANLKAKLVEEERDNLSIFLAVTTILVLLFVILTIKFNAQSNKLKIQQDIIVKTNNRLTALVAQKETLLKEVNHRVKNNLSVLTGMMYLQQQGLSNIEAVAALKSTQLRINTIALIHESLYQRDDMEEVRFQDYITKLIDFIRSVYWGNNQNLTIEINCENLTLNLNQSIPFALLLNELITNSFKYAFTNVKEPTIGLNYDEKENIIVYFDNGPGVEKEIKTKSLGLKLIELFAQQLNIEVSNKKTSNQYQYIFNLNNLNK